MQSSFPILSNAAKKKLTDRDRFLAAIYVITP